MSVNARAHESKTTLSYMLDFKTNIIYLNWVVHCRNIVLALKLIKFQPWVNLWKSMLEKNDKEVRKGATKVSWPNFYPLPSFFFVKKVLQQNPF